MIKTLKNKKLFLSALLILCLKFSFAQYSFNRITKEQGLPHNNVECILQSASGFMWFGTRDGFCRFDGYEVKVYRNTQDTNSISGNRILSVAEDKDGFIWVGTYQNGVNRFNPKTNQFKKYGIRNAIGNQIYRIKVLKDGTVIIGSNSGLALYDKSTDSFKVYYPNSEPQSINSYVVSDILETHDGQLFIATFEKDIQRLDRKTGKFFSISYNNLELNSGNYRKRLLEDREGNLWISADKHGLCKYNRKSKESKFYFKKNGLSSEVLTGDMIVNSDGKIWIASDGGGINILDTRNETFDYVNFDDEDVNSLPSNQVYTLYKDNANRIWVGTYDKGVAYYDPLAKKFANELLPDNICSFFKGKSVLGILQDSKGNVWIGTDGSGLHVISKENKLTHFYSKISDETSISGNVITSLAEDVNGNILVGTYNAGLNIYDYKTKSFKHFHQNSQNNLSLHSENVWTILVDSQGKNWLGLLGNGVDLFNSDTESFKNIGPSSRELIKIDHSNVMSVMEDSDGDIWFGTEGNGIYVYDKQANNVLRISTNSNITTEGVIKDLFQDKWGNIWIGTEGNGLFKYNKKEKEGIQYTLKNGLPSMIILGIQEDAAGGIWVTTYDGIAVLSKDSKEFMSFDKSDGLSSNEFNAQAFIKLQDGTFLTGSKNGLDIFNPSELSLNLTIPKVYFTKLKIQNQEVLPGDSINQQVKLQNDITHTKEIELTYSDKVFSIEFAALNYTHPKKCQYKYKLEGFDENWYDSDSEHRFVSYSNLKNGNYTFKVQASNNDKKWGDNIAELSIRVLPPFWKTKWFIFLVVGLIIGIAVAAYNYRLRLLKIKFLQEQALKEKRITELEKENIESELEKLTFYTVNRNRVLINYKNRMLGLAAKAMPAVKSGLQIVIDEIDNEINDDKEWKYLEPRLDKMYNEFISKLRNEYPDLTLSEVKVASYVRMNLSSKEIAEFMHKTTRAIENDRYRLRKKLELDSNESLQKYLMDL
ncbi:two-component regulator propeller domain-containing protein [Labilibaculum manganireducens]|uniref:two-component regulator propeller domain-containing protein n=1 Tax=Labilibaculum manganireducens TaxID=1940525 RepID=UPI0029F59985|nr:two-component regulator propeller domain-containing protein [Labilibaculum manganireducens]